MLTRIIDINTDIRDAYAQALAEMETVELTCGTPISRGASIAYKWALKQLMTELGSDVSDKVDWPRRAVLAVAAISDLEHEYLKLQDSEELFTEAREVLDGAAEALETLADLILNAGCKETEPEPEPETGVSLIDWDDDIRDAYAEAMSKVEAAMPAVEKMKGPQIAQAYIRLLEETCTRKNLGYETLLEPAQQCAIAKAVINGLFEAYNDMWLTCQFGMYEDALLDARITLRNLRETIGDAAPEGEGKQ